TRTRGRRGDNRGRFLLAPVVGATRARFIKFAQIDARNADAPRGLRQPFEIAREKFLLRPRLESADANEDDAHSPFGAFSFYGLRPAGRRSTSSRDCRTDGRRGERCARS